MPASYFRGASSARPPRHLAAKPPAKRNGGHSQVLNAASVAQVDTDTCLETSVQYVAHSVRNSGFAFVPSSETTSLLSAISGEDVSHDPVFTDSWSNLGIDPYMGDGGKYRTRRHAHYSTHANHPEAPQLLPYRPNIQSKFYNPLNGGEPRFFAEVEEATHATPTVQSLLDFSTRVFSLASGLKDWHVEMHQLRVETSSRELGKITPEGAHQDGCDYGIIFLTQRVNVEGGLTTIYDMDRVPKTQFTLLRPYDMCLISDREVFHGVEPIVQAVAGEEAYRDVMVFLYTSKSSDLYKPWPPA